MRFANIAGGAALILTFGTSHAALTDGLVAYYPFDGNANDASGYGNNGTVVGGVSFVNGIIGDAAQFDGSTGYVIVNSSTGNLGNDATIDFWFLPTATAFSNSARMFEKDDKEYWWFATVGNGVNVALRGINSYGPPQTSVTVGDSAQLTLGWTNIAMRKSGSTMDVFLDGVLVSSVATPVTGVATAAPLYFGKSYYWNTYYYAGLIDDARIYNRALSDGEIGQLAAVPESTTAAMVLAGLSAVQLVMRRRERKS